MRKFIDIIATAPLTEARLTRVDVMGREVRVWINPSHNDFCALVENVSHEMRGLVDPKGTLYLFDAYEAIHYQVAQALGVEIRYEVIMQPHFIEGTTRNKEQIVPNEELMRVRSIARAYGPWAYETPEPRHHDADLLFMESQQGLEVKIMQGRDTLRWIGDHEAEQAFSEIKYFYPQYAYSEIHVVVLSGGEVAAVGGFEINPDDPTHLWVKFISTRPKFRRQGFARLIYQTIYPWAAERHLKIAPGGLSQDGTKMAHIHDEMYQLYPDAAFARDARGNYLNDRGQIVRSGIMKASFGGEDA